MLSPDGKTLAATYQPAGTGFFSPFEVRLWDVATGAEKSELSGLYYYAEMAFSPDSRLVVTCTQPLQKFAQEQLKHPANQIFVWDVATGRRLRTLPEGLPAGAVAAAFSDDGRALATATPEGLIQNLGDRDLDDSLRTSWSSRSRQRAGVCRGRPPLLRRPGHDRARVGPSSMKSSRF